jgi:hypothetical protein
MKATDKLLHPDFVIPGALMLLTGLFVAALQFLFGHVYQDWLLAGIFIGAGLFMLARTQLGTVLLGTGIAYGLYWIVLVVGLGNLTVPRLALSALTLLGLILCLLGQIKYFFRTQCRSKGSSTHQKTKQ